MTDTIVEQSIIEQTFVDNQTKPKHGDLRHIVNPPDNPHISHGFPDMLAQEVVNIARANGIEIKALCGVVFVPTKDPNTVKETCDACLAIAGMIMDSEK